MPIDHFADVSKVINFIPDSSVLFLIRRIDFGALFDRRQEIFFGDHLLAGLYLEPQLGVTGDRAASFPGGLVLLHTSRIHAFFHVMVFPVIG